MRNIAAGGLLAASTAAGATITSTVEAAGVQATTMNYAGGAVTFDTLGTGYRSSYSVTVASGLNAIFDPFTVAAANDYGGAYGTNYMLVGGTTSVSLSKPVNFVGLWGSALDGGNSIELLMNGSSVGTYNLANVALAGTYYGNPNNGLDAGEKFAFFNFVSSVAFNQVRLLQNGGGGFELDNLTFGTVNTTPASTQVPEPMTIAILGGGLGLLTVARRRRLAGAAPLA